MQMGCVWGGDVACVRTYMLTLRVRCNSTCNNNFNKSVFFLFVKQPLISTRAKPMWMCTWKAALILFSLWFKRSLAKILEKRYR